MDNENQPISNQNQEKPKNFWQRLKLWQKISIITLITFISLLLIFIILLLFCTNIDFDLTKKSEYVSCANNSDCIKSCDCLNKEGASKFSWLTNLCGIRVKCRVPSACTCESRQCKCSYNYTGIPSTTEDLAIREVFDKYIEGGKTCDIDGAYKIISATSKEIVHFTCQNYQTETHCYEGRDMDVKINRNTAVIYRVPFSHKVENPVFFVKENGNWKIAFSKMAFGMAMAGSTCDSGWSWINETLPAEFCGYFKKGECPEEVDTSQTSQNILISTDKLEYTPDEKILITIKNDTKKEIRHRNGDSNCLPDFEFLGNNGKWVPVPIVQEIKCAPGEELLLPGKSASIEYTPSFWSNKNFLNFTSYKFGFKYTTENDESAFEKYGHFEVYSNEFKIRSENLDISSKSCDELGRLSSEEYNKIDSSCQRDSDCVHTIFYCDYCLNKEFDFERYKTISQLGVEKCGFPTPICQIATGCKCVNNKCEEIYEKQTNCDKLKEEVRKLKEEIKYCQSDNDCILDKSIDLVCPFGCYLLKSELFDDGEYLSLIKEKMEQYKNNCQSCIYECPYLPEQKDIKCKDNKCTDIRF